MRTFTFDADSEEATGRLGRALAAALPDVAVIALSGTLGAGKTRLVQAIAEGRGIDRRDVVSPTFVLVQQYGEARPIYHVDAYRVHDDDEFLGLGIDEYYDRGLVLIEWAERVDACLPRNHLLVVIDVVGAASRRFSLSAIGGEYDAVLERLATLLPVA